MSTPPAAQTELFPDADSPAAPETYALFADVVFDRPMDHPYSYAVPDALGEHIAVGKRVEVPFGRGGKMAVGYCVHLSEHAPLHPVKPVARVLDADVLLTDSLLRLTRWMADYYLCAWGQVLHAVLPAGVREHAGTRNEVMLEAVPALELPDHIPSLAAKQTAVLKFLRQHGEPMHQRELMRLTHCTAAPVGALLGKGMIRKFTQRMERPSAAETESPLLAPAVRPELNADQLAVWQRLEPALAAGGFAPFLLHGVTGSGKTEVYLRAIEATVAAGREVIVLVPEISLTPQTIERFRGRCGRVAVMHSNLTDVERAGHWRRVAAGEVSVVVGARSAVFAPTPRLGLIVIDEEHETTFKQESTPRYHARDVAMMRARLEGVPIVVGSATPALESYANAQRGAYTLLEMPNRVNSLPMPPVSLVDMRHEPRRQGPPTAIGETLERATRDALAAGGQVIFLLNRRGFSTHVHCPSCGYVVNCESCDLSLTFHKQRATMLCHHCGFERNPVQTCPKCQKQTIKYNGSGTEKLHEEVRDKFPNYVCERMDSDTMGRPGAHARVLEAFRNGLVHILVGTQMIAKGLDFPNVTLVGVVNADAGLHQPDFRAAERTFQLLAQVAGRAGRGVKGGRVLVQTYAPEHPCIAHAARHDYTTFAREELAQRQAHQYPPYQRLARLIVRSDRREAAEQFAGTLAGAFRESLRLSGQRDAEAVPVRVLGPAEAPVFRLNGLYRFHFQIQSASARRLHEVLREVLAVVKPPSAVEYQLDIDPYGML